MTHREIVIRLAEAYIKAGQSIEADKIIKIADYFMAHTNDYNGYSTSTSWITAINNGSVPSILYGDSSVLGSSINANTTKSCTSDAATLEDDSTIISNISL